MAIFGSMLVAGLWWLMVFVAAAAYFTFSARMEEALMLRQFPDAYPAYKARTKMLIPYIL
jgi:protein-S-isoprenylcysteine O-methyltransferase Ste14